MQTSNSVELNGKGKISREEIATVIRMAWPSSLESFFMALTGLVDTYMVSTLGPAAVAAVGLTGQPRLLGLAPFFGLKLAISAMVARRLGQGERKLANSVLSMGLVITICMSIVLSTLSVVFAKPLMLWVGAEPDTVDMAAAYFRIVMGGMIFNTIQLTINAAQRGIGNTRIAMVTNVVANAVNVVFNYLLIGGHFGFPALGVQGAAIATVLGTVVSCCISISALLKKDAYVSLPYILREKAGFVKSQIASLAKLTGGELLEQVFLRFGFLVTAMLVAKLGTGNMAAHQLGMHIITLSFAFGDGLSVASVALIGKSLGEERPELAKRYGNICFLFSMVLSIAMCVIFLIGGKAMYTLFFPGEDEIIATGVVIMRVAAVIVLFQMSQVVFTGSLRGAGDIVFVTITGALSVACIRLIAAYFFAYVCGFGVPGIWLGILSDQVTRFLFMSIRYRSGKWMRIHI